jgi:hypothetical protein
MDEVGGCALDAISRMPKAKEVAIGVATRSLDFVSRVHVDSS